MKTILNRLTNHEKLSKEEARQMIIKIAEGKFNPNQIAAFLTVYMMRNISLEELEGFRTALLELCVTINLENCETIDLCGTGGDGKDTFNISTLAAFVTAGAGIKVSKHGNYGVSSGCGSSNVLEELGIKFSNDQDFLNRAVDQAGICILHAPLFHPAMKNVAPVRKALGVKTFFNMLGPLVNPAFPKNQLTGVFNLELARLYHYLFQKTERILLFFMVLTVMMRFLSRALQKHIAIQANVLFHHKILACSALRQLKSVGAVKSLLLQLSL